jgi:hypothetical protein
MPMYIGVLLAVSVACSGRTIEEPEDGGPPKATGGAAGFAAKDASVDPNAGRGGATSAGAGGTGASTGAGGSATTGGAAGVNGSGGAAGSTGTAGSGGNADSGAGGSTSAGGAAGASGTGGVSGSTGVGGAGGVSGAAGNAGAFGGWGGVDGTGGRGGTIDIDAGTRDAGCIKSCRPSGGQYCGRIGDGCGGVLDCGSTCDTLGFTCGGAGQSHVCGAARDSGVCTPLSCSPVSPIAGRYCGVIGDGCGGMLTCPLVCPSASACAGGGIPNQCGTSPGSCPPRPICAQDTTLFCGIIGDGCMRPHDCGACPDGQACGLRLANVCGTPCHLCQQIPTCESGTTSLRGTAVTAALVNPHPLPGARVYIPNLAQGKALPPLPSEPACEQCRPPDPDLVVASTVTGADGSFTLDKAPAGNGIPLVVELGRWRRLITVDIQPCVDNAVPAGLVRLPRNQAEGDIPLTAIATGDSDRLQCLLRKMGISDSEFTNPTSNGRFHFYRANGARIDANTPDVSELVGTVSGGGAWHRYAQVLLACTGLEALENEDIRGNLYYYLGFWGGRVLATHFAYSWLYPDTLGDIGTWTRGAPAPSSPLTAAINTTHARGADFAKWLEHIGALSSKAPPQIAITAPAADLGALTAGGHAQAWISSDTPATTQLFSIEGEPSLPPEQRCGRLVFSDFHMPATSTSASTFPAECDGDSGMTPQESALEFMLFEMAACINPAAPPPPPAMPIPAPPPPPPPAVPPPPPPPF